MSTQISQVSYPSTYWSYMIILYSSRFFLFHPGGVSPCLLHQLPEFAVLWQEGLSAKNGGVGCGIRNCRSEGTIDRYYDVDIWLYLILFPTEMNRVFHSIAFNASTDELLSLEKKPDPIFRESLCSLPGPVFPPVAHTLHFCIKASVKHRTLRFDSVNQLTCFFWNLWSWELHKFIVRQYYILHDYIMSCVYNKLFIVGMHGEIDCYDWDLRFAWSTCL